MPGTTFSAELPDPVIATTLTLTIPGVTEWFVTSFPRTFYTTALLLQPSTYRTTIKRPGTTYVETYTTEITIT